MRETPDAMFLKLKKNRVRQRYSATALCLLSLVVATGVFWQLRLVGISMTDEACCGKIEHIHTEECIAERRPAGGLGDEAADEGSGAAEYEVIYSCGFEEEHIHTLSCYSDPNADIETDQDWETTLPDTLKGNWAKDLIAVARSQIGYSESENNFILAENETTMMGYTRYGEWFGNPYGDWSAMFVSFCMHYSGIPEDAFPQASGAYRMAQKLSDAELLEPPGEYQPKSGDVVFFDLDHDGRPERVGMISEVDADGRILRVIEGDYEHKVVEHSYLMTLPDDAARTAGAEEDLVVLLVGDIYGYCDIGTLQAISQVDHFLELGENATIMARPMMQALTRDETGKRIPWAGQYEQLYIDAECPIRAVEYNGKQIIEVQIADEYDNFKFDHAYIHKHSTQDLAPDAPEGVRNPGVTCQGEGRIELEFIEYREMTDATTGKILHYAVLGFDQSLIDTDDGADVESWCVAAYYDLEEQKTSQNPATFFDYDYSGGANGGNGINSEANYRPGTTQRLGVGLKDKYHTGGHDNMGNHPWNAPVTVYDANGEPTDRQRDANANNGQNENDLIGDPIIQGLITGAVGNNYENVQWTVDEPGLFSQSPSVGKNIYSNYDLEFFNLGNTYVLDGVFNKTTEQYSTQGVFNVANNGTHQEGANFWPLDDLRGSIDNNQFFNHIYAADIRDKYHNWYFGMRYDFSFSLTPDYVGDLYFTFAGDDDMWVLLDGEPILDLGGMHSAYPTRYQVSGPDIEFPQGGNTNEYQSNSNWKNRVDLWDYLDENDFGAHTLTVLYMERGGYDSNCYMEFTLPNVTPVPRVIIPNAELEIRKVGENGQPLNGAEFMLCEDKEGTISATFYENKNLTGKVEDGILKPIGPGGVHVYGITDGTYYLFETAAPPGHEKLDGPVLIFTVTDGMITQTEHFHGNVDVAVSGVQVGLKVVNAEAGKTLIDVKAVKRWNDDGADHSGDLVTVHLLRNDKPMAGDAYTAILSAGNDWTHIWTGLPTSDKDTGELYRYTVVEEPVAGYGAEYEAQWVPGLKAWVKTDVIVAGETYILTNGTNMAMYTNANGATVFGTNKYPANNSAGNFSVSINGDILTADSIPSEVLWTAQANGDHFQFLSKWSRDTGGIEDKYLRIEGNGNTFKTANAGYKSNFSYANGQLMGFNEGNTNGEQYRVRFENGKFASGGSNAGNDIVPFALKNTPDTYEITITNTPEYGVELPETGGPGTFLTTLGGLSLMALPLLYGCVPRRRRERGTT